MNFLRKFEIGVWNIGVIERGIDDLFRNEDYRVRWVRHGYKDRFFADPFLYRDDTDYYYFFAEELKFYEKRGIIVLLKVSKRTMKLISRTPFIQESYHLSFPNYDPTTNTITPEANQSGALFSYEISNEKLIKRKISDYPLIDATFLERDGNSYIFATMKTDAYAAKAHLHIFVKQGRDYVPIRGNPVIDDIGSARPAGRFFEHNGVLYRPAQDSSIRYGCRTKIMKVKHIDKNGYAEEPFLIIEPDTKSVYRYGLHTFNVYDSFIVVDGYSYRKTPLNFFFVKFPAICKKMSDSNIGLKIETANG